MDILDNYSISSLREAILGREISPTELCTLVLGQVGAENSRFGILTDTLAVTAMREAEAVEERLTAGEEPGRLAGIPIVVKDNIDTVPAVCSAGLPSLAGYRPEKDAAVVKRLRREGAVIIGVAATDSGAFGVTTPSVKNPVFPGVIAGGSSGGSAAAVAVGFCKAALGTDTGGSIRIPAACCGVAGFKPTYGLVPSQGVRPLSRSVDHIGPLAKTVADLRSVVELFTAELRRPLPARGSAKVGLPKTYFSDASDDVKWTVESAAKVCREIGHSVEEIALPLPDDIIPTHLVLSLSEAAQFHMEESNQQFSELPSTAQEGILLGKSFRSHEYLAASDHRRRIISDIERVFQIVDYILLPTLPILPPEEETVDVDVGGHHMSILNALIRYTAAFDQTGHPALSMPWPSRSRTLPGSIQLVGARSDDLGLLSFAEEIEKKRNKFVLQNRFQIHFK